MDSLDKVTCDPHSWYGIKAVDAGFDSDQLMFVTDHYGGGCAAMGTVGTYDEDIATAVAATVLDSLQVVENATLETLLFVEFCGAEESHRGF